MGGEKMLAVRLSPELVDAVRNYAALEKKHIRVVVEEAIQAGLQRTSLKQHVRYKEESQSVRRKLFAEFRRAQQRGEVIPWAQKKMLAVRLPTELVDAIRNYAVAERKNITVVLEEFLLLQLGQYKGLDGDLAALRTLPHPPFRARRKNNNRQTVTYETLEEKAQ